MNELSTINILPDPGKTLYSGLKRTDEEDTPACSEVIGVSACLAGIPCRYDGNSQGVSEIIESIARGRAFVICPECLGGLPIPRIPAEIVGGAGTDVLDGKARVIAYTGETRLDVTDAFVKGAYKALDILRKHGCSEVILKANSPSCGCGTIYDGTFSGVKKAGSGVTAALFKRFGITVHSL